MIQVLGDVIHLGNVVDAFPKDFIRLVAVVKTMISASSHLVPGRQINECRVTEQTRVVCLWHAEVPEVLVVVNHRLVVNVCDGIAVPACFV